MASGACGDSMRRGARGSTPQAVPASILARRAGVAFRREAMREWRETRHEVRCNRPKSGMPLRPRARKAAWPAAKVRVLRHLDRPMGSKNGMVGAPNNRYAVFE
jgi:hypothetical protein